MRNEPFWFVAGTSAKKRSFATLLLRPREITTRASQRADARRHRLGKRLEDSKLSLANVPKQARSTIYGQPPLRKSATLTGSGDEVLYHGEHLARHGEEKSRAFFRIFQNKIPYRF